mmetsp:Transcript_20850/g.64152  ORF Transcript_20850/g.64152 Transcript_20850/m.64152 type:complete len:311 (-) Transcript_20850:29-961(-)
MSKRAFITLLHACAAFAPTPRVGRAPALRVGRGPRPLSAATTDATKDVAALLRTKRAVVDGLAKADPNASEMTRLRFASAFATQSQAAAALRETAAWRAGAGKPIVEAASKAVAEATAAGGWNNEPVRAAAPHASKINRYVTPSNVLTLSTAEGDLAYVIKTARIDDRALMKTVSVAQLCEWLLYVKEVHALIANARSERTGRLCQVVFANDVAEVRAIPDSRFSEALSTSSNQYEKYYPGLGSTTCILNLPFVLQAFVGLFRPLFPKSVQDRLKFATAPYLAGLKDLGPLSAGGAAKKVFLGELKRIIR